MLESKVAEMLGQLSDKLGVASAKIWEWSLLQVKVEIVQNIICGIVAIALTTGVCLMFIKYKDTPKKDDEEKLYNPYYVDSDLDFGTIMTCIGFIILIAFDLYALAGLLDLPQLLINPEYSAFQNIVEQLGQLK